MNPATDLVPQLKQLRLSAILDSLEARNRQAINAKLAYTEFLALLIQDEVAQRASGRTWCLRSVRSCSPALTQRGRSATTRGNPSSWPECRC